MKTILQNFIRNVRKWGCNIFFVKKKKEHGALKRVWNMWRRRSVRAKSDLNVFVAHNDLAGSRHVLQHWNLVVDVGKAHEGTQDGLSLDPRSLRKKQEAEPSASARKQRENSRFPGRAGGHCWAGWEETRRLNFFHLSTRWFSKESLDTRPARNNKTANCMQNGGGSKSD